MIELSHLQKLPTEDWLPRREMTGAVSPPPRSYPSRGSPSRDVKPRKRDSRTRVNSIAAKIIFVVLVSLELKIHGIHNASQVSTILHLSTLLPPVHCCFYSVVELSSGSRTLSKHREPVK